MVRFVPQLDDGRALPHLHAGRVFMFCQRVLLNAHELLAQLPIVLLHLSGGAEIVQSA